MSASLAPCSVMSRYQAGSRVRQTGHDLAQIMHAAQHHTRLIPGARERGLRTRQGPLCKDWSSLRSVLCRPGHHVRQDQPRARRANVRAVLELRQVGGLDDRGLVGQHVQAGFERGDDPFDLAVVAAREDGNAAERLRLAADPENWGRHARRAATRWGASACRLYRAMRLK